MTGARLLNTDIRRSQDDPQPYVIFERAVIEQSGAVDINDFLKTRLTMSATGGTSAQTTNVAGAVSGVNLRGLGENQTLILIDGRRAAKTSSGFSPGQPDLNGIPLAAIERIEVLPTTASAIYGGAATGGVVNVVLRRDYSGLGSQRDLRQQLRQRLLQPAHRRRAAVSTSSRAAPTCCCPAATARAIRSSCATRDPDSTRPRAHRCKQSDLAAGADLSDLAAAACQRAERQRRRAWCSTMARR